MPPSPYSRLLLLLERTVQKSLHHRWCNCSALGMTWCVHGNLWSSLIITTCSSIKENTGYKGMDRSLLMAAHHWRMSQHWGIIDYYGHIVSLTLLLQRHLNKLSVQHCYYNSFNNVKCVYYTSVQTGRYWFPHLWPSSHQAAPCILHIGPFGASVFWPPAASFIDGALQYMWMVRFQGCQNQSGLVVHHCNHLFLTSSSESCPCVQISSPTPLPPAPGSIFPAKWVHSYTLEPAGIQSTSSCDCLFQINLQCDDAKKDPVSSWFWKSQRKKTAKGGSISSYVAFKNGCNHGIVTNLPTNFCNFPFIENDKLQS